MAYPSWLAGQRVTAALLRSGRPEYVVNSGAAQTNATTTVTAATSLSFSAEASATYHIMAWFAYDAPTATDIKGSWSVPTGATMVRNIRGLSAATTDNTASTMLSIRRAETTEQVVGAPNGTANAYSVWSEDIILTMSTTAGTVQFQFAANAAGTATLQNNSYFIYQRIA